MNLIGLRVDGLLVCVSQETADHKVFEYVRRVKIPLVFFDRAIKELNFSYVAFNDKIATIEALNQLISGGYTKIAHFAGYSSTSIGSERCNGFREALINKKIPIREDWIIEGGYEIDDGIRAFEKLSATGELPEIILAVNDRVASGAYKAIRKTGLKIPDNIGILGYGLSDTARLFSPTLSVIDQDPRKMGRIAVNLLIDEIQGISQNSRTEILIDVDFQWNTSILKR
jgi:LacI family transcriptional regulator